MPGSFRHLNALLADRVTVDFPDKENTRVLDVGAGAGKWRDLLHDYPQMDAIEVHEPYIREFHLGQRYRTVFHADARQWPGDFHAYDLVICGDVIEHMEVLEAHMLLGRCRNVATIVVVPYLYDQDDVDGVESERHIQADLTHEIFEKRYPGFDLLARDERCGVYVRDPRGRWTLDEIEASPHVMLSIPLADWRLHMHCAVALWETLSYHLAHDLCPLTLHMSNGASVEKQRNRSVASFLANKQMTHLCFIDPDQGWRPETIGLLLQHRAHVIGVPIRMKVQELHWNITRLPGTEGTLWNGNLLEVGGIGTGFLMISRPCLERMIAAYPELATADDSGGHHTLFQTGRLSEDFTFCDRWRQIGGRVWADPKIEICHIGVAEFSGKLVDHMEYACGGSSAEEDAA